jgi:hypothetical protein
MELSMKSLRIVSPIAMAVHCLLLSSTLHAQSSVATTSLVVFRGEIEQFVFTSDAQYAFMIGQSNVTEFAKVLSENSFEIDLKGLGLSAGRQSLEVLIPEANGQARVVQRFEIDIAPEVAQPEVDAGVAGVVPTVEKTGFQAGVTLGIKSRLNQSEITTSKPGPATPTAPTRNTYADLTTQIALKYADRFGDGQLSAQGNLVGSSYQTEALRFATSGNAADKLDLASYDVQWSTEKLRLSLGHLGTGGHPLLASDINHRGVGAVWRLNETWDISASLQSGLALVGFPQPTGLSRSNDQIRMFTTGWTFWQQEKGKLRAELTNLSAQQMPRSQNGIGQAQERSSSSGWGLRILGNTTDQRGKIDWSWASSQYAAPGTLNPGFVTPGDRGAAMQVQLAYDLLRQWTMTDGSEWPLSVTTQWRSEKIARDYRSLGAAVSGDLKSWALNVNGTVGPIAWLAGHTHRQDNVSGDPNFPVNLADTTQYGFTLPLSQWTSQWWPSVGYNTTLARNRADPNRLPSYLPAASAAHLLQRQTSIDLNWTWDKLTTGVRWGKTDQDNRDLTNNDTVAHSQDFTWNWQAMPNFALTGSLGSVKDFTSVSAITRRRNTSQLGANWRFGQRWTLAANASRNRDRDDQGFQKIQGESWHVQVSKQFEVGLLGVSKQSGSFWVRLASNQNTTQGVEPLPGISAYVNDLRSRSVTAGLSVSF